MAGWDSGIFADVVVGDLDVVELGRHGGLGFGALGTGGGLWRTMVGRAVWKKGNDKGYFGVIIS